MIKTHQHLITSLCIDALTIDSYLSQISTFKKFGAMHPQFSFRPLYTNEASFYEAYSDVVFETIPGEGGPGYFYSKLDFLPLTYTDIYLFRNPINLLSYLKLYPLKGNKMGSLLISFPRSTFKKNLIQRLTSTFALAKFHCCFDTGPQGDLLAIRIAMSTLKRDFSILLKNNFYSFTDKENDKSFSIPNHELSLGQFRKKSGLSRVRCIRNTPPKGFNSFNHLLRSRHEYQTP